jgi:hypothetical protein
MAITYTLQKAAEESGLSMRTLQYAIGRAVSLSPCKWDAAA